MSLQETTEFFERYRDAFNRLDGDAVTALWHGPGFIADTHGDACELARTADGIKIQMCTAYQEDISEMKP